NRALARHHSSSGSSLVHHRPVDGSSVSTKVTTTTANAMPTSTCSWPTTGASSSQTKPALLTCSMPAMSTYPSPDNAAADAPATVICPADLRRDNSTDPLSRATVQPTSTRQTTTPAAHSPASA